MDALVLGNGPSSRKLDDQYLERRRVYACNDFAGPCTDVVVLDGPDELHARERFPHETRAQRVHLQRWDWWCPRLDEIRNCPRPVFQPVRSTFTKDVGHMLAILRGDPWVPSDGTSASVAVGVAYRAGAKRIGVVLDEADEEFYRALGYVLEELGTQLARILPGTAPSALQKQTQTFIRPERRR